MKEKKKIIVDLDVTTFAFWDKKDEANLIGRIKTGLFSMIIPYIILDHLAKWNHRKLAEEILSFYEKYSSQIITAQNILDKINEIKYIKLLMELVSAGVKEEDVILVIIASVFDIDFLVTFNRKHLKSKEKEINEVLSKNGVRSVKIKLPSEL